MDLACYHFIMEDLLKYSYLLDAKNLDKTLESMWNRYQQILDNPNWQDLNEARAILYIIGFLFTEQIAPEAIKRRLHLLAKPLTEPEFYTIIDTNNEYELGIRAKDDIFNKLVDYYNVVKKFKNKTNRGKWYLDEDIFVKLYNQYCPDQSMEIGKYGEFGEDN